MHDNYFYNWPNVNWKKLSIFDRSLSDVIKETLCKILKSYFVEIGQQPQILYPDTHLNFSIETTDVIIIKRKEATE